MIAKGNSYIQNKRRNNMRRFWLLYPVHRMGGIFGWQLYKTPWWSDLAELLSDYRDVMFFCSPVISVYASSLFKMVKSQIIIPQTPHNFYYGSYASSYSLFGTHCICFGALSQHSHPPTKHHTDMLCHFTVSEQESCEKHWNNFYQLNVVSSTEFTQNKKASSYIIIVRSETTL